MANAFMNTFSEYRNVQAAQHKRYGKTLSMSWPLWKDGGMHVDAETERMLTRDTGMVAMEADDGIQALYHGWASGKSQLMVAAGVVSKIHSFLDQTGNGQSPNGKYKSEIQHTENASSVMGADEEMLREKAEDYFKSVLSSVTKLPVSQIDAEAPMEDYGIDSIMIMHVTGQLEKVFGSLSKTLFFEYLNIRSLSQYFTESHREKLLHILGIESETSSSIEENRKTDSETEEKKKVRFAAESPDSSPSKEMCKSSLLKKKRKRLRLSESPDAIRKQTTSMNCGKLEGRPRLYYRDS